MQAGCFEQQPLVLAAADVSIAQQPHTTHPHLAAVALALRSLRLPVTAQLLLHLQAAAACRHLQTQPTWPSHEPLHLLQSSHSLMPLQSCPGYCWACWVTATASTWLPGEVAQALSQYASSPMYSQTSVCWPALQCWAATSHETVLALGSATLLVSYVEVLHSRAGALLGCHQESNCAPPSPLALQLCRIH
jgi:hypothetical protein